MENGLKPVEITLTLPSPEVTGGYKTRAGQEFLLDFGCFVHEWVHERNEAACSSELQLGTDRD
jgi:hypothetical protein